MAAARGIDEEEYCERYSYRIFKIHASAHFKERFMPFAVLIDGLLGGEKKEGNAPKGKMMNMVDSQQPARRSATLPSWFQRKPGRRYQVMSNDAPLGALRGAATEWATGGQGSLAKYKSMGWVR